jgi:release factor glutamine methyltransferase
MPKVPSVWTVLSMLEWATDFFEQKQVNSPRFSIEWLLSHVLDIKRLDLYLEYDRPLSSDELDKLRPLVKRRGAHEPLQYITGETDFHHVKIKVRPGVLIPRQETEELVSWLLELYPPGHPLTVIDIGTGAGCIPVALKKARPNWEVYATDISDEALAIARENAVYNQVEVHFKKDDLFKPELFGISQFDLIISNPPYVLTSEKSSLDREVKDYEPELALFCESTENMYRAIEELSRNHIGENGDVFLELHRDYAPECERIFISHNWKTFIKKDYSDNPRFLKAEKA